MHYEIINPNCKYLTVIVITSVLEKKTYLNN